MLQSMGSQRVRTERLNNLLSQLGFLGKNQDSSSSLSLENHGTSINGAGKTGELHIKNKTRTLLNSIHKDKLKNGLNT